MTDAEIIETQRQLLSTAYKLMAEHYMLGTAPDQIARQKAFIRFDRALRACGALPETPESKAAIL